MDTRQNSNTDSNHANRHPSLTRKSKPYASHDKLIECMQKLGYAGFFDRDGVCFGLASMGINHIRNGIKGINAFNLFFEILGTYDSNTLAEKIKLAQKKRFEETLLIKQQWQNLEKINSEAIQKELQRRLTEEELILVDIPVFFEGIAISHHTDDHKELLEKNLRQYLGGLSVLQSAFATLPLTSLVETDDQGLIKLNFDHFFGTYDTAELEEFFASWTRQFKINKIKSPVSFLLHSKFSSSGHAISVGYLPDQEQWVFIESYGGKNTNRKPATLINDYSTLAWDINYSFRGDRTTTLTYEIFTTHNDHEKLKRCVKNLSNDDIWNKIHNLTPTKAQKLSEQLGIIPSGKATDILSKASFFKRHWKTLLLLGVLSVAQAVFPIILGSVLLGVCLALGCMALAILSIKVSDRMLIRTSRQNEKLDAAIRANMEQNPRPVPLAYKKGSHFTVNNSLGRLRVNGNDSKESVEPVRQQLDSKCNDENMLLLRSVVCSANVSTVSFSPRR